MMLCAATACRTVRFRSWNIPPDIGFRAYGTDLSDLFANCACALLSLILDASRTEPVKQYSISAEGSDSESRLVNFLK